MSRARAASRAFLLALIASLTTAAASAAAADPYPGIYQAKTGGVKGTVELDERGGGVLRYATRTKCGRARGQIALKRSPAAYKGKRIGRGPHSSLRTTAVRLIARGDGTSLEGVLSDSLSGGENGRCRDRRRFSAELGQSDVFVPEHDTGHYEGRSKAGLPISFDLVEQAGQGRIVDLRADVLADCYDSADNEFPMVVHIGGLAGEIAADGSVDIFYSPDDETEYEASGTVGDGEARLDIAIYGSFDATGTPSPSGPYECDSWGAIYTAVRQ